MKRNNVLRIVICVLLGLILAFGITGCKKKAPAQDASPQEETSQEETIQEEESEDPDQEETPEEASSEEASELIDEEGVYDSKEDVALYIHTYGHLPYNYMTKKEAKKLGWQGGSLDKFAPGMIIGGDPFGNYEGNLPDDKDYFECDIDTLGKKKRGAKRIVYSEDGFIYYTDDHYETFELLYEGD